jgi:hypothetical protein
MISDQAIESLPLRGDWNAWADIVIKIWRQKMAKYQIGMYRAKRKTSSHESLFASFERHLLNATGGNTVKIDFLFKAYGIFVDMGVGREVSRGNSGDLKEYATERGRNGSKDLKRKRKPWYSKVWYNQVVKLREYMAGQIGEAAANTILFGLQTTINGKLGNNSVYDAKYGMYREKDLARNAMNYKKRNGIIQ